MTEERVKIFGFERHRIGSDGEGVTTLIALHGCPLRCKYCLNSQCQDSNYKCREVTASEVIEESMIDNLYFLATGGGLTIGGGEPLMHPQFINELRERMPEMWNLNIETSMNVPLTNIKTIVESAKTLIIDIKDMDSQIYQAYTRISNERTISNLKYIADKGLQDKCIIRLPLIPSYNNKQNVEKSKEYLQTLGFTHFDKFKYKTDLEKSLN